MDIYYVTIATAVGVLSLAIGILSYRLNIANRRSSLAEVSVDWRMPVKASVTYADTKLPDTALFFECLLKNSGGRATSIVSLVPNQKAFVHYLRRFVRKKPGYDTFDKPYRIFNCLKPVVEYSESKNILSVLEETELKPFGSPAEVPLNIIIRSGESLRFTLCFWFSEYARHSSTEYYTIVDFEIQISSGQRVPMCHSLDE